MKSDQVSKMLGLAGDGPAAIAGLRRLAVGLAVGGKFRGYQTQADLEAVVTSIAKSLSSKSERDRHIEDDIPEALRGVKHFVRLGSVARIEKGQTGIQSATPGTYPLVVTAENRLTCDHYDFDGAAAIVPLVSSAGHGKASLQRLHYQEGKFALGSILAAVFPNNPNELSARFLFEYLSVFKDELLVSRMIGTANVTLTLRKLADVPIPLVSPAAQAKVDELMALCDQLEAARAERERRRDRLTAASLARLSTPDPATFQADARFALDALPAVSARADQVKRLRQTIQGLAVRGKLVAQEGGDEPAMELLGRIASDKVERAISARDRTAIKIEALVGDWLPFVIPPNWVWARFGDIVISRDGERIPVSREERAQRAKVFEYYGASGVIDKIDSYLFDRPLLLIGEDGANLINRATPIAYIARGKYWVNNHAHVLDGISEDFLRYLELFINATDLKPYVTGTAQPKMNQAKMNSIPVAVPPLPELHRIVARVDELMALCDQLEASLTTADATRSRLLDALIYEALDGPAQAEAA